MTDFFGRKNANKTILFPVLELRRNPRLYGISLIRNDRLLLTKMQYDPTIFLNYFLPVFDTLFPLFTGTKKSGTQLRNKCRELHREAYRLNGYCITFKNVQL